VPKSRHRHVDWLRPLVHRYASRADEALAMPPWGGAQVESLVTRALLASATVPVPLNTVNTSDGRWSGRGVYVVDDAGQAVLIDAQYLRPAEPDVLSL